LHNEKLLGVVVSEHDLMPRWSADTKPYWDALHRNELLYQRCESCRETVFHPRGICPYCLSDRLSWRKSAGRGTIYSFTVQRVHSSPAWRDKMPMALGIIAMDEGYHMFAQLLADDLDSIKIGLSVTVVFDKVSEQLVLPKFRMQKAST
jgi:uncharacterized OB-fold protein